MSGWTRTEDHWLTGMLARLPRPWREEDCYAYLRYVDRCVRRGVAYWTPDDAPTWLAADGDRHRPMGRRGLLAVSGAKDWQGKAWLGNVACWFDPEPATDREEAHAEAGHRPVPSLNQPRFARGAPVACPSDARDVPVVEAENVVATETVPPVACPSDARDVPVVRPIARVISARLHPEPTPSTLRDNTPKPPLTDAPPDGNPILRLAAAGEDPVEAVPRWVPKDAADRGRHPPAAVAVMVAACVEAVRQTTVNPHRCGTDAKVLIALWRCLDYPDPVEFAADLTLVAEAARDCPDRLFARDIRGEGWNDHDRSGSVKTLAVQESWGDRLAAAKAWAARGRVGGRAATGNPAALALWAILEALGPTGTAAYPPSWESAPDPARAKEAAVALHAQGVGGWRGFYLDTAATRARFLEAVGRVAVAAK